MIVKELNSYIPIQIKQYFLQGHDRTLKAKKNIVLSTCFRSGNILLTLALVPLFLNILGQEKFGIWLTISSVTTWIVFFDIGLGNGLRNNLTKKIAENDFEASKIYVSTTYAVVSLIAFVLFAVFMIINPLISWSKIFNTSLELAPTINKLVIVVFFFTLLSFVFKLIGTVLLADHKSAANDGFTFISKLLILLSLYIVCKTNTGSLLSVGLFVSLIPPVIFFLASIFFFTGKYKNIRPSLSFIKPAYFKNLANLGIQFFIIQICFVVIFSTDNIIIAQVLGPIHVTPYNIAYRYMSIPSMLASVILSPYWSSFTDAYHKEDYDWIKRSMNTLLFIIAILAALVLAMVMCSGLAYDVWLGDVVRIPFVLTVSMGFYTVILLFSSPLAYFLNGVGKIRLQLYYSVIVALINIPLSIFLAKYMHLGSSGVILATCLCLFPCPFLWYVQYNKIINNEDKGLWGL